MNFDYAWCLEQKNELTEHLTETLTPYIYEGLMCIYKDARNIAQESKCQDKTLLIFQKLLQAINGWNQLRINEETQRIKQLSNTAEYFDDLVKAVIKANITLLTNTRNVSNVIARTFYDSFTSSTFVHRCYTECGKDAHNNPYLFYDEVDPLDRKRNEVLINQRIQEAIPRAIRKVMPINLILKEYLVNSMNILHEQPNVELVGINNRIMDTLNGQQIQYYPQPKIDPKLEKDVMKIIKSEHILSDKQKVQNILNMDKLLTSMEPADIGERSAKYNELPAKASNLAVKIITPTKKMTGGINAGINPVIVSSISKNNQNVVIAPILEEKDDNDFEKEFNDDNNLGESDQKVLNIRFDDEPTMDRSSRSVSATSLNSRGNMQQASTRSNSPRSNIETSERIDPSKVNLIEDYGGQKGGGSKKIPNRRRRKNE